jgi:hypothetical protein
MAARSGPGMSRMFMGGIRTAPARINPDVSRAPNLRALIDADRRRVELTWRAAIPIPKKYEEIERIEITEKTIR